MKLSTAIRKGAKLRPQAWFTFYSPDGRSCALGAAYEALYGCVPGDALDVLVKIRKACHISYRRRLYLTDLESSLDTFQAVTHLNDALHWTREHIADWVEAQGL